ncbi:MAG TPA: VWA domain-containing protein [Propionibacterium sp.]|nr:VWA domain-containing protein [Propionibacterium sp.]
MASPPPRGHTARYGRYRGGPDPLAPPVDLAEALEHIGREVMDGSSPERAMREYLRRGTRSQTGLDDLARQVARKRQQLLQRHRLDGTLEEIRELLDQAVLAERKQLARDLDDDARFAEMRMENLPPQTAAAVNELRDYDWRSSEAREAYQKIADLIGRESLDQRFAGMKQALENATDEDRARVNEMLQDLNELLEAHARGEDTDQQFRDFMAKHGEFFPEQPQNIDELLDALAQRAAAAQRMRNSLSPDQRAELDALAAQAFGSPELMESLTRLDQNLMALRPGEDWDGSEEFEGQQGMGLGEATGMMQELAELDELGEQLSQQYAGAALDDVDLEMLGRHLGDQAAVDARTLAELEKALREHGYLQRGSDNTLRLSPKAMRQLGKALLRDVAERLSGRTGNRDTRTAGAAGERTGSSRPWEFGDTEPWDVTRTVANAVQRTVAEGGDASRGVRLGVGDIEVTETEARTQAAVALLVDTSFSMAIEGRWVPMKRTGLALHHLISTRFRGDAMTVIGFGRTAGTLDIAELTALQTNYGIQGTNLHHALLLANRFFRRHPSAQPVLLVVTDGEPTAHLEPDGEAYFDYPPSQYTLSVTVNELDAAMRLGAQTTFFRLGDDPGLARFTEALARRVEGRVIAPELDDLGAAVVGSYLSDRRGWWMD